MSDTPTKTHQTITVTSELSVPVGDYCLDYSLSRKSKSGCWHLSGHSADTLFCEFFEEDLKMEGESKVIKCTKCKEAKVKI